MPGPGTVLKGYFSLQMIDATPDCMCNQRADMMDFMGPRWCLENIETIIDWLEEEATNRGLPFHREGGRMVVIRAIHKGRGNVKLHLPRRREDSHQNWFRVLWERLKRVSLYIPATAVTVLFTRTSLWRRVGRGRHRPGQPANDQAGKLPGLSSHHTA